MGTSQVIDGPLVVHLQEPLRTVMGGHPTGPTIVKVEEPDYCEGEGIREEGELSNFPGVASVCDAGNGVSFSSSSMAAGLPRPMQGLQEAGPPPFLRKTFEMVEDQRSECVVSWSESGRSFVVWDPHEFSKVLLPKYFKHNNFSSFIRQLNTYGFRKMDPDRWDFAHEFFQRGQKPLLKNIRRRARPSQPRRGGISPAEDGTVEADIESEAETLKRDHDSLRVEIVKLRQQHDICRKEMGAVEERIRRAENRHHHIFLFLSKAFKSPSFPQQLLLQRKKSSDTVAALDTCKKRPRLDTGMDLPEAAGDSLMKPENQETAVVSGLSEAYYNVVSQSLLGNGTAVSTEDGDEIAEALKECDMYMEFEGFPTKSTASLDWDGYGSGLLEPATVGLMP
ncbi:hypothetical protein SAY87_025843 [Trapa incisa]|uniref:HSF-type DNA-binding domain-containing protein n=1 Tax=Trapa incisa TaxID=236973 RepID=A0AAN7GM68_9MYRT|nr:hypothetical protein SAY87_025843 [Trapa incisa]